ITFNIPKSKPNLPKDLFQITVSFKDSYERLDYKDEKSQRFSLNEKYRGKLKEYFKSRGG
ncbi:MAG: hypothetical protein QW231_05270, partial [Candidatus Bathyarchaeia archaeon]